MRSLSIRGGIGRHVPVLLVLLIGTVLSLLVFQVKRDAISERQRAIFAEEAHGFARSFHWQLETHLAAVQSVQTFAEVSSGLSETTFAALARASLARSPALDSVQWVQVIAPDELDERGGGSSALHFPILYATGREPSQELVGFDYASDPVLLPALLRAQATTRMAVSQAVQLPSQPTQREKLFFFLPVKALGGTSDEVEGIVAAQINIAAIARAALADSSDIIGVQLIDQTGERPVTLFSSDLPDEPASRLSRFESPFSIGEREWKLILQADPRTLTPGAELESLSFLAGGLFLTTLFALWTRQRQDYVFSVEREVGERTAALSRINADLQNEMVQRRHAETELQQSETRFREAFLHAPVGIGLLSPQGKWMQVNEALVKMTGFSKEELHERTLANLLHPDEVNRELARMGQMLAGEIRTFALEQRFRHRDGDYFSVLMNISQVRDGQDRLLYFVCQLLDITERNRALEETRQAKEFSENIIKSSHDGIFAFDMEGQLTLWNAGMEEMTGISQAQAIGRPSQEVLPFLISDGDERGLKRVLAGGTVRAAERPFFIPSSDRRGYCSAHYTPLHDDQGGIIGGVALVRDVTEQRQARERLQAFTELLKQRNRELQDFAYVASHDLQEPLRKIRAFGDRLAAKCEEQLDEQAKDYLKRMQSAAGRMQTLITDLLTFSRVSTEAHPFAEVSLSAIVQEVLVDLESRIEETGARIEVGSLPSVEADSTQMRQLLQNLIGNAIKYHRPGVPPHVQIYATTHAAETDLPPLEGTGCLLHIEDNGIGFEAKYLDRIFTVFQRLHGRNEYPGTGVGLAICRKIAERHNGWITARSVPGEGSTFITGLPYRQNKP